MLAKASLQPMSRQDLEFLCTEALRSSLFYRDLTAVDIDLRSGGDTGTWDIVQLWRGHIVELPQGRCWDAAGREVIAYLASRFALMPD